MNGPIRHPNFTALYLHLNLFQRLDNVERAD